MIHLYRCFTIEFSAGRRSCFPVEELQRTAKTLLILFSLTAVMGLAVPAFADPFLDASFGDVYVITTLRGYASAYINGQHVTVAADIQLKARIVAQNAKWIAFTVTSETAQIGDHTYALLSEWPGLYNRSTGRATYQGYGTDGDGHRVYFSFASVDTLHTQGAFMDLRGSFRDPSRVYWNIRADMYRFKLN
jgi:hypothetical protein